MLDYTDDYILEHMISGKITQNTYTVKFDDRYTDMIVNYDCIEMIGRERIEEYQFDYGKDD